MKKRSSSFAIVLLTLFIFAGIFTCNTTRSEAADYALSSSYKVMYVGQTYQNIVKNTSASVKWTSANSNIASVSGGLVSAKNIGITYIYAEVGATKLTMKVEVVSSTAYKAVTYANSKVGCKYSQSKRMSTGYYDCGSLVWRAYQYAGYTWGSSTTNAPTAADGAKALNSLGKTISYSGLASSKLLAGDLVYTSTRSNGRYRNITHAAFYTGNGNLVEAANTRKGVCRSTYKTTNVVLIARPSVKVSNGLQEPQLVSAVLTSTTVGAASVKVTWNSVRNATGYIVYRKVEGGSWARIATITSGSTVTYTDTKAYAGNYYYTVRAYKTSTSTLSSYNATGLNISTTLAQPATLTAASAETGVQLNWGKVSAATSYEIRRKASNESSYKTVATVSGASTVSYLDKTAVHGVTYTYAIRAIRKNSTANTVYSKYTYIASAITYKATVTNPTSLTATNSNEGVKLAWTKVSNATGYEIRRKASTEASYKTVATITGASTVSYLDQTAKNGVVYTYAIRSIRKLSAATVYSKYTYIAEAITAKITLAAPATLTAVNTDAGVKLNWGKVTTATAYEIRRKASSETSYKTVATVSGASTLTYLDKTVEDGASYTYAIRAIRELCSTNTVYSKYTYITSNIICELPSEEDEEIIVAAVTEVSKASKAAATTETNAAKETVNKPAVNEASLSSTTAANTTTAVSAAIETTAVETTAVDTTASATVKAEEASVKEETTVSETTEKTVEEATEEATEETTLSEEVQEDVTEAETTVEAEISLQTEAEGAEEATVNE